MTIAERLDQIQTSQEDRGTAATAAAEDLSDCEILELLALVLGTAPGVSVEALRDSEADVLIGRATHRATVRLGAPDQRALVVLQDRGVGLQSESGTLHDVWGPPLILDSAPLLQGIQYARDEADGSLYRPAVGRLDGLRRRAAKWGLPFDVLLALSSRRGEIASADQSRAA